MPGPGSFLDPNMLAQILQQLYFPPQQQQGSEQPQPVGDVIRGQFPWSLPRDAMQQLQSGGAGQWNNIFGPYSTPPNVIVPNPYPWQLPPIKR